MPLRSKRPSRSILTGQPFFAKPQCMPIGQYCVAHSPSGISLAAIQRVDAIGCSTLITSLLLMFFSLYSHAARNFFSMLRGLSPCSRMKRTSCTSSVSASSGAPLHGLMSSAREISAMQASSACELSPLSAAPSRLIEERGDAPPCASTSEPERRRIGTGVAHGEAGAPPRGLEGGSKPVSHGRPCGGRWCSVSVDPSRNTSRIGLGMTGAIACTARARKPKPE
mmetsp:Transcript_39524/g.126996  ORF Transcript_39524/g.126996 Transcript_39524/m.126996 type:complete len:224 (-) Transcript_39524:627-1298(-)